MVLRLFPGAAVFLFSYLIEVIFGVAEYDQPKVYEAGFIPRSLLRNENAFYRLDTP